MDLRLLGYFVAACEAGSLHRAAERLHVAQPSLSRQIRGLEASLGFTLFDRTARGLVLTAAGREFLPVARDLLDRSARAQAAAQAIAHAREVSLRVTAAPTTVADIVAPFVVRRGAQGVIGNVVEANPEHVYGVLQSGAADVAVGTRVPPVEYSSIVVGHAFLWAQVPATHRFAALPAVPIAELVAEPLIVMSGAHGVRRMFDDTVARASLSYTPAVETESYSIAQALAAAGRGVCILSDDSRYDLVTVPILAQGRHLTITLFGVWDPLHYASGVIAELLEDLTGFVAELYPQPARRSRARR